MNNIQTSTNKHMSWIAVGLALIAALAYILIGQSVLGVGDLSVAEDGGTIVYVAAGCYMLGGILILTRRNWLLVIGAVINALVMLFFFRMYQDRLSVMFSAGGLATKIAQLLLEVALVYIIARQMIAKRHVNKPLG